MPSISEIENDWKYIATPPYVFMSHCLIKYRDNDTFTIYEREVATSNLNHTVIRTEPHSCELGSVRELQIHKIVTLVGVRGQMGRLHRFRK